MERYHREAEIQAPMLVRDLLAPAYRPVAHPVGPLAILLHEVDVVCGLCGHVSAV
jgi:hypothetical protein